MKPQRHYLAVFFLSFLWGVFGVDRFYLGKVGTGLLKLLTFGGFGIWVAVDLILIMGGKVTDKQGRPLLQYQEYKGFTRKLVLWYGVILGTFILLGGLTLIASVYFVVTGILDGTLFETLNGFPQLTLPYGQPLDPSLLEDAGL